MKLLNSNRFYLPGQTEFLHLASVSDGVKEYICFANVHNQKVYIEDISNGSPSFIEDDFLVEAIADFLTRKKVLDLSKPLLPDDIWYRNPNEVGKISI